MSEDSFPTRSPIISSCVLSLNSSIADLPGQLSLIVQHISPTSSTPGHHNLLFSPSSKMRNPKKCIVFLPRQRRQCKSTKASKAEGREGEEFFPAILGELCAGHGRMYLEEKDLQFIEDDETAVGSEVGERAESLTGGTEVATEGELEASIATQSSHAVR